MSDISIKKEKLNPQTRLLGQHAQSSKEFIGQKSRVENIKRADETFKKVKGQYTKILGGITGASLLGILLGSLKYGTAFPSKILQVIGDGFGSIATLATPFVLTKNEFKNYKLFNKVSCNGTKNTFVYFDDLREAFYRSCSLGFTPFIFEPFINPEKFGKSIFHKIANYGSLFNLGFAMYTWGFGNFQALIAWLLRRGELLEANKTKNENQKEDYELRAEAYNRIYQSAKRMAVIGSITNPILQNVRQWADTCSLLFTKEISIKEFFERPILGFSRVVSFVTGIPEFFAKTIDSLVRVLGERKHLAPVLPEWCNKGLNKTSNWLDRQIAIEGNSSLKAIRHFAEVIFHTLSPMSMFALFAPMLDEPYTSEEAQGRGGVTKVLDTSVGTIGKSLTVLFTGLYVAFARAPQSIIQIAFYGKKILGKLAGKDPTKEELENTLNKISEFSLVKGLSDWAHNTVERLVPGYYKHEHEHKYLTFEEIAAEDSFAQAKEEFKNYLIANNEISSDKKEEIINYCLNYVKKEAIQDYHKITQDENKKIRELLSRKIEEELKPNRNSKLKPRPKFPGAYFLATYIFRPLDIATRIKNTDCASSYRNMKTVYRREEIDLSFDGELNPVITECIQGFRRTIARLQGITA